MLERIHRINKIIATPAWHGTQPLPDDTSEYVVIVWEQALGIFNLPGELPFVPTFRNATGSDGLNTWPISSTYFASMDTAEEMAKRYADEDDKRVSQVAFGGTGGLFTCDELEYHIAVNGESKNAGLIAAYFARNPEDRFPGVADKLIRKVLGI